MPPVDKTWDGSTDGDFNKAANWTPSGVPVATDSLFFNKTSSVDIDGYDASGIALANMTVTDDYTGTIGASGDPLIVDLDGTLTYNGRGTSAYIQLKGADATDTDVIVEGTSGNVNGLHLSKGTNGTIENPFYLGGNITIADGTTHKAASVVTVGSLDPTSALRLTMGTGITGLTTLLMLGGTATVKSAVTNINLYKGTLKHTAGAVTTANLYGGTLKAESADAIGTTNVYRNATLDGSGSTNARIWTAVNLFDGGFVNAANGKGNIDIPVLTPHVVGALGLVLDDASTLGINT